MAKKTLEKIKKRGVFTYTLNGSDASPLPIPLDLAGLVNYRLVKIETKKRQVTPFPNPVIETKRVNYQVNGTGAFGIPTYKSEGSLVSPSQENWDAGKEVSVVETYENWYLKTAMIPVGILDTNKSIIKPDAPFYNGNDSTIVGLRSNAPKIFQGTEASFVVIESPFIYGPELYEGGCGNNTEKKRGDHSRYSGYAGYNYYRKGKKLYGSECCGYGYGPTYRSGNINCRQQNVNWNGSCSVWSGRYWELPDLESISRCVYSGNWYNDQFFTRGQTKGFNFWSNPPTNKTGIQKAMDFVEGQTKIDLDDLYSPSNTAGFRARIIPWVSGTHDDRLKQLWLLSSDGKLATYYAKPNTKGHSYGSGYWPNYHCINTSTPTTLTL